MKRYFFFIILFLIQACATAPRIQERAGETWTSDKPDKEESASVGFDYMQANNEFLEALGDHHLIYDNATGWKDVDPTASYILGPFKLTTRFSGYSITGRSFQAGDLLLYGANYQPFIYSGSKWVHAGSTLPAYADDAACETAEGACAAGTKGKLYFRTDDNATRQCNGASGWATVGNDPTAGVDSITADTGGTATGAVSILGGTGIATSRSSGDITISLNFTTAPLYEGTYQEIPGITFWLDGSAPPTYTTCTVDSTYTLPCMQFSYSADQIIYFSFDVPKNWKSGTDILLTLKGFQAGTDTTATNCAIYVNKFKVLVPGSARTSLTETTATKDDTSFCGATDAPYKLLTFTLSNTVISATGTITGKIYRDADAAEDDLDEVWTIFSIGGYYQMQNNP